MPSTSSLRIELVGEARHIGDGDALGLAVAALRHDLDQAARRFEHQPRLGLGHRHDAGVEQHRRDADRVRARHRRRVLGLHDDEAHLRLAGPSAAQQVDVPEDAAARLVQHEVAQRLVAGDEARLRPERVARRRRDAADDDVADLALGVAGDDLDGSAGSHLITCTGSPSTSHFGVDAEARACRWRS